MSEIQPSGVSVVIPARNEEANIERVVRSVGEQNGLLEIIVVDDDSSDRTAEILKRLEGEIPALRTIRVETLPAGWAGKTHAAATGAESASGEWLLFTDADTEHLPGSLECLLRRAKAEDGDMLSLSPGQETPTWWEKAVIPRVFVQLARWYPFDAVSNPDSPRAAANGQYLLVRRRVYESVGGFASVRESLLDDVAFAERVKAGGGRIVFLPGAEWVRTRMYRRFGEMWAGWTKNLFLLAEKAPRRVLLTVLDAWLGDALPVVVFLGLSACVATGQGGALALAGAVGCLVLALLRQWNYACELGRLGFDRGLANYQAVGSALFGLLLVNSFIAHRLRGSVEWKGRRYGDGAAQGEKER